MICHCKKCELLNKKGWGVARRSLHMAHVRKDTLVTPGEWWKHLRPFLKRLVSKAERKAARKEIEREITE
jgi:hypothetical protein